MSNASTLPAGWHSVTPRIFAENAEALVRFIAYVFDAAGTFERERPTVLTIGDSVVMISDTSARPAMGAFLYVYVADVGIAFDRAVERGVDVIESPTQTPYGDTRCTVADRWGNTWQIATMPARR
jgi:PhnB protein